MPNRRNYTLTEKLESLLNEDVYKDYVFLFQGDPDYEEIITMPYDFEIANDESMKAKTLWLALTKTRLEIIIILIGVYKWQKFCR